MLPSQEDFDPLLRRERSMGHSKTDYADAAALGRAIRYARGLDKVPLLIRGAQWLDVFTGQFREGDVALAEGRIVGVGDSYEADEVCDGSGAYLVPGFIDSHVHIESSLMTPVRFQELVLPRGTTTALWDPHEIANVLGLEGIRWALAEAEKLWLDVFVMIPSCVPSTNPSFAFESSGAALYAADLRSFRQHPKVLGLAEMMNFPGLLNDDADVLQKLIDFQGLRMDGHCPGLGGKDLNAYAVAGIHSCHESTTAAEAWEKLSKGIHVLIREGSCAKDAAALLPLLNAYTSATIGLCSDDRNPLDILDEGHMGAIIEKGLKKGLKPEDLFRAASFAPARMYGLGDRGALAPGYRADLCLLRPKDARTWTAGFTLEKVWKGGRLVQADALRACSGQRPKQPPKNLNLPPLRAEDLVLQAPHGPFRARVIEVIPGQILTRCLWAQLPLVAGEVQADAEADILKIMVLERHKGTGYRTVAFVKGFGLSSGGIATSINHDSHNIIAVASSDALLKAVIEDLQAIDGGICVRAADGRTEALPLPIGGLMTDVEPEQVAQSLRRLKALTHAIGCRLEEPFLQLSFLALPVIPSLKITDRGLIDVDHFAKVPVFEA